MFADTNLNRFAHWTEEDFAPVKTAIIEAMKKDRIHKRGVPAKDLGKSISAGEKGNSRPESGVIDLVHLLPAKEREAVLSYMIRQL